MTGAIVKVETLQDLTPASMLNENLIERFLKFASVAEKSRTTYFRALKQMFCYFKANEIVVPTRENLIDWFKAMNGDNIGDEKSPRLMIDKGNVLHVEGDIAADGEKYSIHEGAFKKGEKVIGKKKSPSTIQLYSAAAKIFFRWLAQEGIFANITDHLKSGVTVSREHKKDSLSAEQCVDLINAVKCVSKKTKKRNETMELRSRAILSLMTTTGLRTIEVVRANYGDFSFERGKIFLRIQGKRHSEADEKVLISKQTYKAITAYIKARGKVESSDPLFASTSNRNKNGRLDTQTIRKMVKANLREIGLNSPRLSAHSLRHTTADLLLDMKVELGRVSKTLRHKRLDTTMIYVSRYERYQNNSEQQLADFIFKE